MRTPLVLLLTALLLSACGPLPPAEVPPDVQPHVDEYLEQFPKDTDGLTIEFDDIPPPVAGYCQAWSTGHKKVVLDRKNWKSFDYEGRQVLLTHELGHCLEGFEHRGEIKGAYYTSVMYPYLVSASMYKSKKASYIKEFLSGLWDGS